MMSLTSAFNAVKTRLAAVGKDATIKSWYKVTQQASDGASVLYLEDTKGIRAGDIFVLFGTKTVTGVGVDNISFEPALTMNVFPGKYLEFVSTAKIKRASQFKRAFQDNADVVRSFRTSADAPVTYGSEIILGLDHYIVIGYDASEISINLKTKVINAFVDIHTSITGEFNGFNKEVKISEQPTYSNVPAYIEYVSFRTRELEVGLHPEAIMYILVAKPYNIPDDARVVIDGKNFQVINVDRGRIQGSQFIQLKPDKRK